MIIWDFFINGLCGATIISYRFRRILFKLAGMNLAQNTAIHHSCYISGNNITLDKGSYVNRGCVLDCLYAPIRIGKNVGIGFKCCLFTTNHDYSNPNKRTGNVVAKPIVIGDGAWIGGGSVISPGVTIGTGCVIAAGSVVIKDCEENCLYGGNPAKLIKKCEV